MFLGLRSVIYPTPDIEAAKAWYSKALGLEPYFDSDAYVGYSLGGYELGLFKFGDPAEGPQSYWGVANIDDAIASLVASGAKPGEEITDVGQGIRMASVIDPTGLPIGLIETPVFELLPVESAGPGL